jgi:beta-N-acetylhexosaminidase
MRPRVPALLAALLAACQGAPVPTPPAPTDWYWTTRPMPLVSPGRLGFDSLRLDAVVGYLRTEVDTAFPGAVVAVGRHGQLALLAAVGHYGVGDPRAVTPETVYDLASLTKVIALTTACILLVDAGRLDLDAPVQRYLPEFRGPNKDRVTIRHLLTHSAGLIADLPLYDSTHSRAQALAFVDTAPLLWEPGTHYTYSDLSAIVLMQVVERVTGEPLDRFLEEQVFGPLGMTATRFVPPRSWRDRIAPTEVDTFFRHRLLIGEVHDESAARLGGVSGNAGLFSTAPDLARFATWLLSSRSCMSTSTPPREWAPGHGSVRELSSTACALIQRFTTRQDIPPGSTRALGWDTPSDSGYSSAGAILSRRSFGHTGYTGTSIWMDPERDLFVILLSNRVNPTRANLKILRVRPHVADLAAAALTDAREP